MSGQNIFRQALKQIFLRAPQKIPRSATLSRRISRLVLVRIANARENNMTCQEVRQLQSNYLDEELIDQLRAQIEAHLATCQACRDDFAAVARAVAALQAQTPSEEAAPWFAQRVLERLQRENDVEGEGEIESEESQLSFQDL